MTQEEEAELALAALGGSGTAFARLVGARQQLVRGFLRRLCGSHADADDLAQETFVAAWSGLAGFRRSESLRSWLCGIAYRKWLTHRRSEVRRQAREAQAADPDGQAAHGSDARLDARAALAALPEEQRAVLALCLAAEFSHAEAAEALGLPLGTVKSHVTRGRARLVQLLGGSDDRS